MPVITSFSVMQPAGYAIQDLEAGKFIVNNGTAIVRTTLSGKPSRDMLTFGTTFANTAAAAAYGTLVGSAGVGTSIIVTDVSIVNQLGTVPCMLGFGTALNGTTVLAKGNFAANGGIQKSYTLGVGGNITNTDFVCYAGTTGTVDFVVSYFITT